MFTVQSCSAVTVLNVILMIVLGLIKNDSYTEHWDFSSVFKYILHFYFVLFILLLKDIVVTL